MLKKILSGLFRRQPDPTLPAEDELPLDPLTVMATEAEAPPLELIDIDNLFFPWLLGSGGAVAQDMNDSESRLLRSLKREADEDDNSTADLVPRMPAVVPLLLRSLRDANVSNRQLADQVAQDPVLLAAVLRQVNSSYYKRALPVRTIEDAIAVMGQNGLRMLVARVAFKPLFNAELGHFTTMGAPRMWELSEPMGVACAHFARRHGVDSFQLFLAGLLQSVGVIVALRVLDRAGGTSEAQLRTLAFHASFAHYARRLARLVGREWDFPIEAVAALDRSGTQVMPELARALHLADRTSKIRVLVRQRTLGEEQAEACLETEEALACYREILRAEAAG